MNRVLPMVVLLFALVFYLLSERADNPSREEKRKVITFWAFSTPARTMLQLKTAFESKHDIEVEVQTVPWEALQQKTLWAIAANSNVPDVIVGSSEWAGGLASNGALEPLNEYLDDNFLKRFFPTTLPIYQFPEVRREAPGKRGPMRQYGVPLDLDMMMIFYRADVIDPMLTRLGMKEFPQDWDSFKRLGDQVARESNAGKPQYLLYLDPEDSTPVSMAFLPASGASFLDPQFAHATFNSIEAQAAFAFFGELLANHSAIRWERTTMEDPMVLYKTGGVLANISGPWYCRFLAEKAPELAGKWRLAKFPQRKPGLPSCGLGGACLAMPYNARHKKEAIELIKFMCEDDFALAYFNLVGSPPPVMSAWKDPVFQQPSSYFGGQKIYELIRETIESARPLQMMPNSEVTKGPVLWAMRKIANQGADVAAILNAAAKEADQVLGN